MRLTRASCPGAGIATRSGAPAGFDICLESHVLR